MFPLPNWLGKSAQLSGWVLHPQRSSPGRVGPGGIGGRPGENRRGRREGDSRTRGAGKEQRVFAPPTQAREACWAPRWGLPPSETRSWRLTWAPSVLLSVSPPPTHTHLRAFSRPVGPKHKPCPLPKPHPCLGPALHSQDLFHLFFSFSSCFLLLWFCFTFRLLFHMYFYFYMFSNIAVSFLV